MRIDYPNASQSFLALDLNVMNENWQLMEKNTEIKRNKKKINGNKKEKERIETNPRVRSNSNTNLIWGTAEAVEQEMQVKWKFRAGSLFGFAPEHFGKHILYSNRSLKILGFIGHLKWMNEEVLY